MDPNPEEGSLFDPILNLQIASKYTYVPTTQNHSFDLSA